MRKNIAIVTGGDSSESVISLQSADQIKKVLNKEKYNPILVYIKGKDWEACLDDKCNITINKNDFSFIDNGQKIKFDCALIAIHGAPGENGKLQAYFELMQVPYTGCDLLTSSLTFNKFVCNSFLRNTGIKIAKSVLVNQANAINEDAIITELGLPCFVKPNEGGSSFGISKVKSRDELIPAIKKAFAENSEVIIEEFIEGREITCGLIKTKEQSHIFPLTEIVSKKEFFDYDAKYTPSLVDEITPAPIPEPLSEKCKQLSSGIYDYLRCKAVVRIDYILKGEDFYFLEVNTIPGMSENSIVPKQATSYGLSLTDLFDMIIEDSL